MLSTIVCLFFSVQYEKQRNQLIIERIAFVPKCEFQVVTRMGFVTGLALAEEPTFHNVFRRLTVNRSVPKSGHTSLINKRMPFGPFHL